MDENKALATIERELTIPEVIGQVEKIHELLKQVMKPDLHYGIIPGTDRPTLLKPGAEKLNLLFRFVASCEITRHDLGNGHREYEVLCRLDHGPTGQTVAEGVGNCSTLESKYRYRNDYQSTGKPVPSNYWKNRDVSIIGGPGFRPHKIDGQWMICTAERIENPDIADVYNTVKKIAKKRAYVDATLTACAASDLFYQDLEETIDEKPKQGKEKKTEDKPKKKTEKKTGETNERQEVIDAIGEVMRSDVMTDEERNVIRNKITMTKDIKLLKDILVKQTNIQMERTGNKPEAENGQDELPIY